MDMTFGAHLERIIGVIGPRCTKSCLGASSEMVLINWLMTPPENELMHDRVMVLFETIERIALERGSAHVEKFLCERSSVLHTCPAVHLLTAQQGTLDQLRREMTCAVDEFLGVHDLASAA